MAQLIAQQLTDYAITLKHCNSISLANISLRRNALNIKYGPNGLGKSTIARSLVLHTKGDSALAELLPFKYREGEGHPSPTVVGADDIKSVLVFDDEYVSQFVFQPDEVLKDSFEIFIDTDEYKQGLLQIESLFEELKETFSNQPEFENAIVGFAELRDAFGVTKGGAISKTSKGFKALSVGGKLDNIPVPLQGYEGFLHGDDPAGWITWQSKGKAYLEMSDNCPFCSSSSVDKETAKKVSEEYESAAVKNISALRSVIERLGSYFEPGYLERLKTLTRSVDELSAEQGQFLANLRGQVVTLLTKLNALKGLSFHALRDVDDVNDVINGLKIDLNLLDAINSASTKSVVDLINGQLDIVATRINDIRRHIGQQKTRVANLIKANSDGINDFLSSAGYKYSVRIMPKADSYRMILEHEDTSGHLESAASHLSYGERNAFALVLFMHQVRRDNPDLVVLDDPVSSFDKTKKFAILHQLFHGKTSLRNFTTLLLTHDIEPAIDIVRTGTSTQFQAAKPVAHFLRSRAGVVEERLIEKTDISTFSQVCVANVASSTNDLIRCIYLRRRYEVHGDLGHEYDVLSSLFHLRGVPARKDDNGQLVELSQTEITAATDNIRKFISTFDYDAILKDLLDPAALKRTFEATDVGYEKVQIFRVMSELDPVGLKGNDAFRKFVNESYHIENEYVMQLNPREFDAVPEYVIAACSRLASGITGN